MNNRRISKNFAPGYLDMNIISKGLTHFDDKKYERAKDLAEKYKDRIGGNLMEKAREYFKEWISKGNRLDAE